MNDDTPMCERHEANYIQYGGYQNQNSHDSSSRQSLHDPNDSKKSLTELNNDVRNDLKDFKRYIRSMRTVHDKLYDSDDGGAWIGGCLARRGMIYLDRYNTCGRIHMLGVPFRAISFKIQPSTYEPWEVSILRIMLYLSVEELSLLAKKERNEITQG
ncbi:hypothetical protein Tco_0257748 [Tanacetum coccineum]